jgi:HPt (histidine-containing phosphotransfer) domain-containing protein
MPKEKLSGNTIEETVFDESYLLEKVGGDRDFYIEILKDFVVDSEKHLSDLKQAISDKETHEAERLAHSLKGSSGNIGATALSRAALRVEKASREKRLGAAEKLLPDIRTEFDRLKKELPLE